ncbi:MAG: glycosyltransferase [Lachnospiraceae bacterium]|nr:glycosyltransferase [Lachnospiraceae bacterium]
MRILYVTTIGITMCFFSEHIKMLLDGGNTVEVACNVQDSPVPDYCNEWNLKVHNIPFSRFPLSKNNLAAYKQMKHLVETECFDVVHTHTPNASACVRLACRKQRKSGLKVVYTAHGFHFYKGAPLKNWLVYYPIEKICSRWTDLLITINKEDYALAQRKMKAKRVEYVPGVGIDLSKFGDSKTKINKKKEELGIPENSTVLLSVGELSTRKNHITVIKALENLKQRGLLDSVVYLICGVGDLRNDIEKQIADCSLKNNVFLLGYRTDIDELCDIADIFVFPSLQEGLPVALMEAMACGLPCIASDVRGNTDLIQDGVGGFLCQPTDVISFADSIEKLLSNKDMRKKMGAANKENIVDYASENVTADMKEIYSEISHEGGYRHLRQIFIRNEKRHELNIGNEAIVLLSVGELNQNKNHELVIKALRTLDKNIQYVIAGEGDKKDYLNQLAVENGVEERVHLLGYRNDVIELYSMVDIFVFPSFREGLSVSLMEAMASGLPCVVSMIRGNVDLIDERGGALFNPYSVKELVDSIIFVLHSDWNIMGIRNTEKIKSYDIKRVLSVMKNAYNSIIT